MEELISDFQKSKLKLEQENGQLKFQVEAQKLDLVNEMEILLKSKEKEQQTLKEENHNQCVCLEMKVSCVASNYCQYLKEIVEAQVFSLSKFLSANQQIFGRNANHFW